MFQQYAVTYLIDGTEKGATTSTVDLDQTPPPDPDAEIRTQIACRRFGRADAAARVKLTEMARLGGPTETPVSPESETHLP